jgi:hypothetical protein
LHGTFSDTAADASPAPIGPFTPWEGFRCIILSADGGTHGNIARATESEARSGVPQLRSFTIGVSEDDLRAIAERGYGGAASTDQDQRAQAISLFITDMLARSAS